MLVARLYNHYRGQEVFAQREIVSKITIEEKIENFGVAKMEIPITPGLDTGTKIELYEVGNKEDRLVFRGIVYELKPVWKRWDLLEITLRGERALFHQRKSLKKYKFSNQPISAILTQLLQIYNTDYNEDWGFEIQKDESLTLEVDAGDDYSDLFDEICKQKELFWFVEDGVLFFKKTGDDLRNTQILEYDGLSANPWNITNIELIGTASGGNVILVEDTKGKQTIDKSQYSGVLTGVVSKQIRKGDDAEKAKQFAKEQARPQRKYQIQVANGSIEAKVGDKIKVEVVNTNSFYDYQGDAMVQSKTTTYSNATKIVQYGIEEFMVSPFSAQGWVESVEKSIKLLRQRKGGGETAPAPTVDLSWYATTTAVSQALQSQNAKIETKASQSFVQWVAQTAQTALNTANQKAPLNHTHTKNEVWLWAVDNTSDEDKPLSRATREVLALKANLADIVDSLESEDVTKPLSARQGKILKGFIDQVRLVLASDDTTLDSFREIVAYIKQNKRILSQLGISNIAGLVEALEGKADKEHKHKKSDITDFPSSMPASDVYARAKAANKPIYNWNEIQLKPATFTPAPHHHYIEVNVTTAWNVQHKVGTTAGGHHIPKKGDRFLVNFVHWTVIARPTLNIDWSGAKSIRAGYYDVSTNMLNLNRTPNSNIKVFLWYDGSHYQMFWAGHNNTYGEIPEVEIGDPSKTHWRTISGRRIAKMKEYFERNTPTPTAPNHSANKQYVDGLVNGINTTLQTLGQTSQVILTKAQWKALQQKDPNTIYFVKGVWVYVGAEKIISSEAPIGGGLFTG